MATELGKAYVQIIPSAKGISGSITGAISPEATSAGKTAGSNLSSTLIKTATSAIAAAGIGKVFASSITEGGALQQSIGGIQTLFKDSAQTVLNYAQQSFKSAGMSANAYMENVTSFSASLISSLGGDTAKAAELANMAMTDMSDNANKMGTDMDSITQTYQSLARGNYAMLDNLKLGYGGTKSEMERLMKDAEKLTGEHYTVGDFADTVKAIHAVQDSLGITGTTAREASTTIEGSFNSMKAAWQDVIGNIADGELDITPSLQGLAETTSTFLFGNFIPMIGRVFSGLPSAIGTFIQAAAPQIQQNLQDLFSGLGINIDFSSMIAGMTSSFSQIQATVQPVIDGLKTAFGQLPALFQSVVSAVQPVIQTLVNGFTQMDFSGVKALIEAILPALQAGFEQFMTIAGPAIDQVVQSFVALWNAAQPLVSILASALTPAFQVLGSFLGGVFSGVLTGISTVFNTLKGVIEFLTPIIQAVVNVFSSMQPVLSTIAEKAGFVVGMFTNVGAVASAMSAEGSTAWSVLKSAISSAWDSINVAINFIKSAFTSAANVAKVVSSAISAVWNGVGSVIKSVASAIGGAINTAKGVFSSFGSGVSAVSSSVNGVINGVKNTFNSLAHINLSGAGAAIMNGFLGGLKSAWGAVQSFVGGIADWIKKHKGPISYDRVLLRPAGQAIMQGLNQGLQEQFKTVQSTVSGMAGAIADEFQGNVLAVDLDPNKPNYPMPMAPTAFAVPSASFDDSQAMTMIDRLANRPVELHIDVDKETVVKILAKPISDEQKSMDAIIDAVYGRGW